MKMEVVKKCLLELTLGILIVETEEFEKSTLTLIMRWWWILSPILHRCRLPLVKNCIQMSKMHRKGNALAAYHHKIYKDVCVGVIS